MSSTAPKANDDGEPAVTTEGDSWETVGPELLRADLERVNEIVRDPIRQATMRIADGDELTRDDIVALREAIEDAERVVELSARASNEATPVPDLWEFLDDEARIYIR
jgi:hypothetical protein